VRHDPDLSRTPPILARLRAQVDIAGLDDTALAAADVLAVTFGTAAERWLGLTDLPTGGLHLTGPGALDAARALLATILTANLSHPAAAPRW
jgi:hypothetical protein